MRFYSNYGHIWVNFTFIDLKIKTHNALVLISGKKKKKNLYELKDSKFILMSTIKKNTNELGLGFLVLDLKSKKNGFLRLIYI